MRTSSHSVNVAIIMALLFIETFGMVIAASFQFNLVKYFFLCNYHLLLKSSELFLMLRGSVIQLV